jgi:hypothetical protein
MDKNMKIIDDRLFLKNYKKSLNKVKFSPLYFIFI